MTEPKEPGALQSKNLESASSDTSLWNQNRNNAMESPLQIHQPTPLHFKQPKVLRSRSLESQMANSTMAQVGCQDSVVSPSKVRENQHWKQWVGLSSSDDVDRGNSMPQRYEISPGISERYRHAPAREPAARDEINLVPRIWGLVLSDRSPTSTSLTRTTHDPMLEDGQGRDGLSEVNVTGRKGRGLTSATACVPENPTEKGMHSVKGTQATVEVDGIHYVAAPESQHTFATTSTSEDLVAKFSVNTSGVKSSLLTQQVGVISSSDAGPSACTIHKRAVGTAAPKEDANEVWKRFVFADDSDDGAQEAFIEAKYDAARTLCPSDAAPTTREETDSLESGRDFETVATRGTEGSDSVSELPNDPMSPMETAASHRATVWSSSTSHILDLSSEAAVHTVLIPPSAQSVQMSQLDEESTLLLQETAGSNWTVEQAEVTSMTVEPANSETTRCTKESFRFAPPKLFIGKHAESNDTASSRPVVGKQRNYRGRRKRRARDGRTDIRRVPDYKDDPIEDPRSDETDLIKMKKQSLFAPLETE